MADREYWKCSAGDERLRLSCYAVGSEAAQLLQREGVHVSDGEALSPPEVRAVVVGFFAATNVNALDILKEAGYTESRLTTHIL